MARSIAPSIKRIPRPAPTIVGVPTPASGRLGVSVGEASATGVELLPVLGVGVAVAHIQSESAEQDEFLQLPFEQTSPASQSELVLHELLHDAGGVGDADGDGETDGEAEGDELGELDGKVRVNTKEVHCPGVGVGNSWGIDD